MNKTMERRKAELERGWREKLSTKLWSSAMKKLMLHGLATVDDWQVVAENIGQGRAVHYADIMGFPVDNKYGDTYRDYKSKE